jgi:hypothetical protein
MADGLGIPGGAIAPTPASGWAFTDGELAGQNIRMNDLKLAQAQAGADAQTQAQKAQELMRAMEIGKSDPNQWDSAMTSLAQSGNQQAASLIGKWNPVRAPMMLQSWQNAYNSGINRNGSITDPSTPEAASGYTPGAAPAAGKPRTGGAPDYVTTAIDRMTPDERMAAAKKYNHVVNAMSGVNNEADLQAVMEDLQGRGMISPEHAQQYLQAFTNPVNGWKNFQDEYQHQKLIQAHLNELNNATAFGINPVTNDPTIKTEWDPKNNQGVVTTITPGGGTTFSTSSPSGGKPTGAFPEGLKDRHAAEYQESNQWSQSIAPVLSQKTAIDYILALDPKATTGMDEIGAVYSMVRALDPTSAVREGEISLLQTAQSYVQRMKSLAGNAKAGHIMTPEVITQMQDAARQLKAIAKHTYDFKLKQQRGRLKVYAPYIDPERAIPDLWSGDMGGTEDLPPPPPGTAPPPKKPPPRTNGIGVSPIVEGVH